MNSVPVRNPVPEIPPDDVLGTVQTLPRRSPPPPRRVPGIPDRYIRLTAVLNRDDGVFVARALEVEVASQGSTVESALANLRDELELYFEHEPLPPSLADELIVAQIDVPVPW
jgi:predicted RNase H-like HicB family nuclease